VIAVVHTRLALSRIAPLGLFAAALVVGCRGVAQPRPPAGSKPPPPPAPTRQANLSLDPDKFWQNARDEVYRSVLELMAQHRAELAKGLNYHKLVHGDRHKKTIALTFDDGPHPRFTPRLLEILKQHKAPATFFVVGEMAEKYPQGIKDEIAAGHNVGNHTYHHVNLTRIPNEMVATEIRACHDVIRSITGTHPHLFRPPGGDYDAQVIETAEALNYTTVLWTDDPGDYASPGTGVIEQRTLRAARNGGIILLHDGDQQTLDILPDLLDALKARGFIFVTIDELMKQSPSHS
jgi:peptidoglycan-N-acetylglucosamine deacetylase